ncbi:glycosyl transferase family protein [Sphingomonas oligophenolica]|uniref:Glycosyl transferase family protein n=2 Tax=Sphingomonas oligophenolica TaxID=301154 RepID=A0A502CSU7_9SPHN|nr:glycosyl transferase family protein [Sphingomonas oligophenolica]
MLFAATGLLIGGFDDLLVDLFYLFYRVRRRGMSRLRLEELVPSNRVGRLAIFVPAWDEAAVIGGMIDSALARLDHDDYRLYVGVYPNDPATIDAVADIAESDPRVRLVIGDADGPTTKADNLNRLWAAAIADEARERWPLKAVVLHDAEDVVHPAELRVFDTLIDTHDVVQLPVLPLIKRGSRLVSGHYADEFAEHHTAQMPVRTALGAGMPLAGTGCAIARATLGEIAAERGGLPFDATSLTEDYELGLRIGERGGRCLFARVDDDTHGGLVAVRAYFPATIPTATRQKARWMIGIALAGWDRTGWSTGRHWRDHWMRMRDRRAPIAVLVLAVAYIAVIAWGCRLALHWIAQVPPSTDALAGWLLGITTSLLVWRLAMRVACTARCYGWREALWSIPRFFVGNVIALVAAPRAIVRYVAMLRGAMPVWDKTGHEFPDAGIGDYVQPA